jgi:GT2 family glycosyltransferase
MSDRSSQIEFETNGRQVYIVVLNWNGWRDTIECLESLFRLVYPSYTVVVCDNDSTDHSLEKIKKWAKGDLLFVATNLQLAHLTTPSVPKPLTYIEYPEPPAGTMACSQVRSLVLIQTGRNGGFAAGCNAGMRYALAQDDCDFVWLLNNDTVVEKDALSRMTERMLDEPRLGICGSVLLNYDAPHTVQAYGGRRYSPWRARVLPDTRTNSAGEDSLQRIDYVLGASMLVRRSFLDRVGLMEEAYTFYFEELDWAARAGREYLLGYAPLSHVYHKEGASLGTRVQRNARSSSSEWYVARSRILFTRKFYPQYLPTALAWVAFTALHRLLTGQFSKAAQIAGAARAGLTYSFSSSLNRS